eukprot:TRINITY_DN9057_c1_g1_i1.p1 TRINITY_DN9057_c1_g1~~TRINITY_DN9057_c1_g1_i1.p1  ORF type:complete len:403 (+),score=151.61 TRINITY_DN9057_c1_g1_i1:74-1282(+)
MPLWRRSRPPPPIRAPEQRWVSRRALCLHLGYQALLFFLWRQTTNVPRQDYAAAQQQVAAHCGARTQQSPAADPLQLPGSFDHLHLAVAFVVADPAVSGTVEWGPGAAEAAAPLRRFAAELAPAGIRVTMDFQTLYYADPLLVSTGKVTDFLNTQELRLDALRPADPQRPLRRDLHLLLYAEGALPAPAHFAEAVRCSALSGWGSVCTVAAAEGRAAAGAERVLGAGELRGAFAYWERLLPRFLGWAEGAPPRAFLSAIRERAEGAACGALGALYSALDLIPGLPLPEEVHSTAGAALRELTALPQGEPADVDTAAATAAAALAVARSAEAAYFAHQLVGQSYFPPDHIVAIYIPFFFPVCITVLMGLATERKRGRRERAASVAAPVALAAAAAAEAAAGRR